MIQLQVKVDHPVIQYQSIKTDYAEESFLQVFRSLSLAVADTSLGSIISRDNFTKGSCMYTVHLVPIPPSFGNLNPSVEGALRVSLYKLNSKF